MVTEYYRIIFLILITGCCICPANIILGQTASISNAILAPGDIPEHVKVMPVFFVPVGQNNPSKDQQMRLVKHLRTAQKSYKKLLKKRDTFEIESKPPIIVHGKHTLAHYTRDPKLQVTYETVQEIFEACHWNRFNCPYVLVIIVMNKDKNVPPGAGRPFNSGINSGGGLVLMSSFSLDNFFNFQGTLQHEFGHSFSLPHVSAYGYDMEMNRSIMSSNNNNYWNGFDSPGRHGILIPEELRILSGNKKVFPNMFFDPAKDIPGKYSFHKRHTRLNTKAILPGQKEYKIEVATDSGAISSSSVSNIVHNFILPKTSSYQYKRMWHSDITDTGWVNTTLKFPVAVDLCKIAVHSQYGNKHHMAHEVRIQAMLDNKYVNVTQQHLKSPDAYISFKKHRASTWRFSFRPGPSKYVVIRGLRFFSSQTNEIFCPPYYYMHPVEKN